MRFPFFRSKDRAPPMGTKSASFMFSMGALTLMQKNYKAFAIEGYGQNPVVHACVDKIATAMSSVDLLLYRKVKGKLQKVEGDHPLKTLLADRPNPGTSGRKFIDNLTRYWLIGGDAYVLGVGANDKGTSPPQEIYLLDPSGMRVIENKTGPFPVAFEYTQADKKTIYPVNQVTGASAILHIKTFNPLDPWKGLSPMVAAAHGIDVFNAGQQWNLRLLQNEARPSGAMVVQGSDGKPATLSDEQYERLKAQIESNFSGSNNAGRPMLLEGGLDWKQMSVNAKDMDHQQNMLTNARFIAAVYGVPTSLVNIPGEGTHANYEQARQALWTDTVLPKLSFLLDEFNRTIAPLFGKDLTLWYDEEMIPALEPLRKQMADRMNASEYLTVNEKRRAMGYDDRPEADVILVPTTDIPLDLAGQMNLPEPGSPADSAGDSA